MSIEVKNLSFSYGNVQALNDVSLSLGDGAVGLLGPNGAGKSTLIRILLGFLPPASGEGTVLGYDIRREQAKIRRAVGYMPEDDCFIAGMDAVTFTAYFGELSGMPREEAMKRAHEVLFYVGLGEARYRLLDTYSAGMKQRLKMAQALVHDPRLLFLDEPTANLDPQGRNDVLELIADVASHKDIQVLLSSHILADIEALCASVLILNKGKLAAEGRLLGKKALTALFRRTYSPACPHRSLHNTVSARLPTRPRSSRGFIAIWTVTPDRTWNQVSRQRCAPGTWGDPRGRDSTRTRRRSWFRFRISNVEFRIFSEMVNNRLGAVEAPDKERSQHQSIRSIAESDHIRN
jgi:ABC-2 type transport system ATP-binding protein